MDVERLVAGLSKLTDLRLTTALDGLCTQLPRQETLGA